ncbi:MAG: hypothetical protein ACI4J0_00085 [Huintestinicola sp.]|uniref:hypothetical protein n=1 Tax=Huintestinicola sp. TaxID=2981661 RepID=UPI003F0C3460
MKRKIITASMIAVMLTACTGANEPNETVIESTVAETVSTTVTTVPVSETVKEESKPKPKPISPLSTSKHQSYFQSDDFSITAELNDLKSSLYYPDIVAQMGGNSDMFAVEMTVKVKNISYEEKSFDCSELTLLSGENALYLFDTKAEEAENIKSGKSVTLDLRALCTLSQAECISGMAYCGEVFEEGESFIPDSFAEIIDIQSADDVRTHLYKKYLYQNSGDYYMFSFSEPASICAHMLGRVGENNEYFAIEYSVTNRSDYALIIDPNKYMLSLVYDNADENGKAELMYISTDEELMYEPKEAGKINGVGKIYEMPDFISMKPEGSTEFTIVYKPKGHIKEWYMMCGGHDEPYYAQYGCILGNECDY